MGGWPNSWPINDNNEGFLKIIIIIEMTIGGMSTNLTETMIDITNPVRVYGTKIFNFSS